MKETMIVSLEIGLVHNIRAVTSEGDRIFSDKPLVTTIDHWQISNTSLQTMQPWQLLYPCGDFPEVRLSHYDDTTRSYQ